MKKIMTLCMMLFMCTSLIAQSPLLHLQGNRNGDLQIKTTAAQQLIADKLKPHFQRPILPPSTGNEGLLSTVKERLDSIILEYNAGSWIPGQKIFFAWNAQNLVIKQENHEFDDVLMQMVPNNRELYAYNMAGEMTERISEFYDPSISQWVNDYKAAYTWNNGKLATSGSWFWDGSLSQWIASSRGTYHYLSNGFLSHIIFEYWDDWTSQWEIGYKQELTYNTANQIVIDLYSFYDSSVQQYYPGSKDEYTYHTNGKVSEINSSFFDTFLMLWNPERKEEFTYDTNNNQILRISSYFDQFVTSWVYSSKEEHTFDALNNRISEISSWYDEFTSTWMLEDKGEYTYDNSVPYASLLIPNTFDDEDPEMMFRHKMTKVNSSFYESTMLTWFPVMRGDLFWSTVAIGVREATPMADMKAIPNPAKDVITIAGDNVSTPLYLRVTDMKGQTVLQQQVLVGEQVSVSHLLPGIYLYQIGDGIRTLRQSKLLITR